MCLSKPAINKEHDEIEIDRLKSNNFDIDWDQCDYIEHDDYQNMGLSQQDLNIVQYNIRGLISKQNDIWDLILQPAKGNIHCLILCETWLNSVNKSKIKVPGYTYVGKERLTKKGGGVGFLIRDDLQFRLKPEYDIDSSILENHWIELKCNTDNVLIGSLYRPPNTNEKTFITDYKKLLKQVNRYKGPKIIGMDHNLDFLKCEKHKITNEFLESNIDTNLLPCITRPTRITKSSATLIDNIFTDISIHETCITSLIVLDISDHLPCLLVVPNMYVSKKQPLKRTIRKLSDKNIAAINSELNQINWQQELNMTSSNVGFTTFHTKTLEVLNRIAPERTVMITRHKKPNPWITKGIINSSQKLRKLYSKTIVENNDTDHLAYKTRRNILAKTKRLSKMLYYQNLCLEFKKNSKKLWQVINEVSGKIKDKSTAIDCLKINNILTFSKKKITNEFGKYFSTVGPSFASKIPSPLKNSEDYLQRLSRHQKSLFLNPTDPHEIGDIISNLPNKISSGNDGINNIFLKRIQTSIIEPLCIIYNNSISEGCFPSIMKDADVVPLYKTKDPHNTTNYRPISLLLTMSKILEKLIYKRVYKFLNDNNLFYQSQYGFRAKHLCDDAINELISNIVKENEHGKATLTIFLDLSKAFDTLKHNLLLTKLEKYGIRGNALEWFRSYLTGRNLRVKCHDNKTGQNIYSDPFPITYGTPQGSCLGPLLFLIFCNDIYLHLEHCNCILFANDTTLYYSHRSLKYLKWCVEQDLSILADWFRANKLTLNINKSDCILFAIKKNKNFSVSLDGIALPCVKSTKFLGIWIDENLTWDKHINELALKLKRNQKLLQLSKNFLSYHALLNLYYAQFHSHLSYSIITWGNMISRKHLTNLQRLQNTCIEILRNKTKSPIKTPNVEELIKLVNCKLGYKLANKLLPIQIAKALTTDSMKKSLLKTHGYNTRHKNLPNMPKCTNKMYHNSYLTCALRDYQALPAVTRELPTQSAFMRACKKIICSDK